MLLKSPNEDEKRYIGSALNATQPRWCCNTGPGPLRRLIRSPRVTTIQRRRSARSIQAEANFRSRLNELGATLLEPEWLGTDRPHRVRCAAGHQSATRPGNVSQGWGICRTCGGNDPKVTQAKFRVRLNELGATLLEPEWLGSGKPHRVRCIKGHECHPRPYEISQGGGVCRACAGKDPKAAEAAFHTRLNELGAQLLEPEWLGTRTPHRVRCAAGHECTPRPSTLKQGLGICITCAGQDPKAASAAFREAVQLLGGVVLEPKWLGTNKPHRVRCVDGHLSSPRPDCIRQGQGICARCRGRCYDTFYIVVDEINDVVKFGITTREGRRRLAAHRRDGYDRTELLISRMPDGQAVALERTCLAALRDVGEHPVRGREYFHARALALLLDVARGWTHGTETSGLIATTRNELPPAR